MLQAALMIWCVLNKLLCYNSLLTWIFQFGYYADVIKDSVDASLEQFMTIKTGKGNQFMDCEWSTTRSQGSGPCTEVNLVVDLAQPGPRVIKYAMRDEAGFFKALLEDHGIDKEWIRFVPQYGIPDPLCGRCPVAPCNDPRCLSNFVRYDYFPRRIKDASKIDVANPKEVVSAALPNTNELLSTAIFTYVEMTIGTLDAEEDDVVTALSMPVFMLSDAAESMKSIKKIGAEEKKEQKRDLIIGILTIVFSVLPFGGWGLSAAQGGVANIARFSLVVAEVGNAGIAIADMVKDPKSAPFAIMGLFMGVGGIRANPRVGYSTAAGARRAMSAKDLKLFSPDFIRRDNIVQNVLKKCSA